MSHYTVDYSSAPSPEVKREMALEDVRGYLGSVKRYEEVLNLVRSMIVLRWSDEAIRIGMSFVGIEGYPVTALIEQAVEDLE